MSNENQKKEAKKIQEVLKELGHTDFSLGHAYELIARMGGHHSWNVASASSPENRERRTDIRDMMTVVQQGVIGKVDGSAWDCTLTASATVRLNKTLFCEDKEVAKSTFLKLIKSQNVDVSIVESPVVGHDFESSDIEIEKDSEVDVSRLVKTVDGIGKAVPGAVLKIGEGSDIFEAKIVTQTAEAKMYLEVRANSEEEARTTVRTWLDRTDLTNPPLMQIAYPEYIPTFEDWEIIYIENPEIQHIQKAFIPEKKKK